MTGKRSKITCRSASHKLFKDKAKNRVDDLQGMLLDLQFARKESRGVDVTLLEEQVNQMLREWKSELNEPSPASSLQQVCNLLVLIFIFIYIPKLHLVCLFVTCMLWSLLVVWVLFWLGTGWYSGIFLNRHLPAAAAL